MKHALSTCSGPPAKWHPPAFEEADAGSQSTAGERVVKDEQEPVPEVAQRKILLTRWRLWQAGAAARKKHSGGG